MCQNCMQVFHYVPFDKVSNTLGLNSFALNNGGSSETNSLINAQTATN